MLAKFCNLSGWAFFFRSDPSYQSGNSYFAPGRNDTRENFKESSNSRNGKSKFYQGG